MDLPNPFRKREPVLCARAKIMTGRLWGAQAGPRPKNWYMAKNDRKRVRQVVVLIPPARQIQPRVGSLVPPGALASFVEAPWASITLTMPSENPGPFVFVRAEGAVEQFRNCPVRIAFAFYRTNAGGLFTVLVHVQCLEIEALTGHPAVFENSHDLDNSADRKLVEALISRDAVEVCFTASGKNGPCTGYFGVSAPLSADCRKALKAEWERLLGYHRSTTGGRSFRERVAQVKRENPVQENPVLDK